MSEETPPPDEKPAEESAPDGEIADAKTGDASKADASAGEGSTGDAAADADRDAQESDDDDDDDASEAPAPDGVSEFSHAAASGDETALSSVSGDEPVPPEATEDQPEEMPPDPGSAEAASPRMQSIVESLLFAADKPLTLKQLGELLGETELARVRAAVAAVEQLNATRGFQLHQVAGGYQFRTNPENAQWVQKLLSQKPVRLTRAQLETLAILAYRQPITRPEIDEIRGVDSGGTLKTLMERALVRILGKKEEPGRPMIYGTTREFLEFFNLGDLKDLPTLREFHELSEEHLAQVAALEGVAPAGSIEGAEGEAEAAANATTTEMPALKRLEIATPPEDEAELEEIDRLIRTAGANLVTDQDQPGAQAHADNHEGEFEGEPTREFVEHEPTKVHHRTIPTPQIEDVDGEFDQSETTSRKPRPEGLAAHPDGEESHDGEAHHGDDAHHDGEAHHGDDDANQD
jgi:segregation and condensation protein B